MASRLRSAVQDGRPPRGGSAVTQRFETRTEGDEQIQRLRRRLQQHPCHGCSEREEHARWHHRWTKLRRETDGLRKQVHSRTNTIAHRFQQILRLLGDYEYVREDPADGPQLTDAGAALRQLYGERDLLTSLALNRGYFEDLDPAALCAAMTALVHEGKRDDTPTLTRYPAGLGPRVERLRGWWQELTTSERSHRLPETPMPDLGLMWPMYRWARGDSLARSLEGSGLVAGDFVRATRQTIDALDQLGHAVEDPQRRALCEAAILRIRRGVILYELDAAGAGDISAPGATSARGASSSSADEDLAED